jgi:D-methionine transport system ATP-binding protein
MSVADLSTANAARDPSAPPPLAATRPVLSIAGLVKRFGAHTVLDGIDLQVERGETVCLLGPSGSGKSTLLRCINWLEVPDAGRVLLEGETIGVSTGGVVMGDGQLSRMRTRIGMVFQHFALWPHLTVLQNVMEAPVHVQRRPVDEVREEARALLERVGLSAKQDAFPAHLSGGQKQRVGIARALAARPALLLSDEATSALDPETTRSILALLKDINRQLGLTILLITHEMEVIRSIADRVAVIDAGRIVEEGPVWSVFANPRSDITRSLLGAIRPQLPPELAARLAPEAGAETVLRVDVAGEAARGPLLSDLAAIVPGPFRLVHGGIDHIQQQPVGTLFLSVPGDDASHLADVISFLKARQALVEVLGHVAGSV